jgi:hypothetical protein
MEMRFTAVFAMFLLGATLGDATTGKLQALTKNWVPTEEESSFSPGDLTGNPWETADGPAAILKAQKAQQKINYYNSLPKETQELVANQLEEVTDPALRTQREAERRISELEAQLSTQAAGDVEALPEAAEAEVLKILGNEQPEVQTQTAIAVAEPVEELVDDDSSDDSMVINFMEKKYDPQATIDAQTQTQQTYVPWVPGAEFEKKKAALEKKVAENPALKTFLDQQEHMRQVEELERKRSDLTVAKIAPKNETTSLDAENPALETYNDMLKHQKSIEDAVLVKTRNIEAIDAATSSVLLQKSSSAIAPYDVDSVNQGAQPSDPDSIVQYQQKLQAANIPWYPHIEEDRAQSRLEAEETSNPAEATVAAAEKHMREVQSQFNMDHPESAVEDYPALHYDASHTWEDSHPLPPDEYEH